MTKKLLFIGMVILVVSSAANAGIGFGFDWIVGYLVSGSGWGVQAQASYSNSGNVVAQYGTGMTANGQVTTYGNTQSSANGTQSTSVTVGQYGYVSGLTPYSSGVSYSQAQVSTSQYQQTY